jgi:hypothetical protein
MPMAVLYETEDPVFWAKALRDVPEVWRHVHLRAQGGKEGVRGGHHVLWRLAVPTELYVCRPKIMFGVMFCAGQCSGGLCFAADWGIM